MFPLFFYILVNNLNKSVMFIFFIGFSYGFGYFLSNLYWISNSLKFDDNFENYIIISIFLLPFLLSLFYGLFSVSLKFFDIKFNFNSILFFSLSLSLIEFLRGTVFGGFPWNLISFSIIKLTSTIQILNIIGTYSLNLLVITFYLLPIIILFKVSKLKKFIILVSAIIILLVNILYGLNRIEYIEQKEKKIISPPIKIVSPKFNIERFFVDEPIENKVNDLIKMSYPLNKNILLVFPEGMMNTFELNYLKNNSNQISDQLTDNSKIILGVNIDKGQKIFNSMALFDKEFKLESEYIKNKLVPFGEFLPFENFLSKVGIKKITSGYKSFSKSDERNIISINSYSFLPLICYEIIFSGQLNKVSKNYDFILNISEDGWFGNSIGPIQHFSHSIFRSIEEGKDVLRVANNGISAHVSTNGLIKKKMNTTEKGSIEINSISQAFTTFFSIYGNKIFFFLVFFYTSLIFFFKKIK